jgi:hypothetical protein
VGDAGHSCAFVRGVDLAKSCKVDQFAQSREVCTQWSSSHAIEEFDEVEQVVPAGAACAQSSKLCEVHQPCGVEEFGELLEPAR